MPTTKFIETRHFFSVDEAKPTDYYKCIVQGQYTDGLPDRKFVEKRIGFYANGVWYDNDITQMAHGKLKSFDSMAFKPMFWAYAYVNGLPEGASH